MALSNARTTGSRRLPDACSSAHKAAVAVRGTSIGQQCTGSSRQEAHGEDQHPKVSLDALVSQAGLPPASVFLAAPLIRTGWHLGSWAPFMACKEGRRLPLLRRARPASTRVGGVTDLP